MNVVFCSSDGYAKCTGVALYSLLENNRELPELQIYLLTTDMTAGHQRRLIDLCGRYHRPIQVIEVLEDLENARRELRLREFKGGLNTYARAMANRLLPPEVKRALFLDSDLLVTGSLAALEGLDMGGDIAAGVYEISVMIRDRCYESVELLEQCPHYINYGVVLLDLENWRRLDGDGLIRKCAADAREPFRIAEQSMLNLAFRDHTGILPVKYNFSTALHGLSYETVCKRYRRKRVFDRAEYEEAAAHPLIVHFIGDYFNRPWYEGSVCRYQDEYLRYYRASPWGVEPLDEKPDDISAVFRAYYRVLVYLRRNGRDEAYFRLRYRWVQWLREHVPDLDGKIKRKG